MDLPIVSVMIVTYDRPTEIRQTINALKRYIVYPPDKLRWHLCDDASPGNYIYEVQRQFSELQITATVTSRKGWGANVNKGISYCTDHNSDFIFLVEDDYVALRPLPFDKGVALLKSENDIGRPEAVQPRNAIGLVRYDGIAAHWLSLQLREAKTLAGNIHYLQIHHDSPFLNVYSNRPHLMHRRFHDYYGMYQEGLTLAETESNFAHEVKNHPDGPWLCTLENGITRAFEHIGKSRQGTDLDKIKG